MDKLPDFTLADVEKIIVNLGYSKNTADMVLSFLKSQHEEINLHEELKTTFQELQNFVEQRLKPRYLARKRDRLLALLDITVEHRDTAFYFTKHLYEPSQTNSRLKLEYLRLKRVAFQTYELAIAEVADFRIIHTRVSLKDCLMMVETNRDLAP